MLRFTIYSVMPLNSSVHREYSSGWMYVEGRPGFVPPTLDIVEEWQCDRGKYPHAFCQDAIGTG